MILLTGIDHFNLFHKYISLISRRTTLLYVHISVPFCHVKVKEYAGATFNDLVCALFIEIMILRNKRGGKKEPK